MNTAGAFRRAFAGGFGLETDVRDQDAALVVSHDPPAAGAPSVDRLLDPSGIPPGTPLAINVKADGLAPLFASWLRRCGEPDVFFFDMSAPEQRRYAGMPCFTRQSDMEPEPVLLADAQGIWLDAFAADWWSLDLVEAHLRTCRRVAIVSPELHGRDPAPRWHMLRNARWKGSDNVLLCTDHPDVARDAIDA
jgi:hypothetical protein